VGPAHWDARFGLGEWGLLVRAGAALPGRTDDVAPLGAAGEVPRALRWAVRPGVGAAAAGARGGPMMMMGSGTGGRGEDWGAGGGPMSSRWGSGTGWEGGGLGGGGGVTPPHPPHPPHPLLPRHPASALHPPPPSSSLLIVSYPPQHCGRRAGLGAQ
jgi:hypothetical protein